MSAVETNGLVRSIRSLLGLASLRGFVAMRGEAVAAEAVEETAAFDFRAARARLLAQRKEDLAVLRADVDASLAASRRARIVR